MILSAILLPAHMHNLKYLHFGFFHDQSFDFSLSGSQSSLSRFDENITPG